MSIRNYSIGGRSNQETLVIKAEKFALVCPAGQTDPTNYTELFATLSGFNTVTGVFTAPSDGYYRISYVVNTALTDAQSLDVYGDIDRLFTRFDAENFPVGTYNISNSYSEIHALNATQTHQLQIENNSSNTNSVTVDLLLMIEKIG